MPVVVSPFRVWSNLVRVGGKNALVTLKPFEKVTS